MGVKFRIPRKVSWVAKETAFGLGFESSSPWKSLLIDPPWLLVLRFWSRPTDGSFGITVAII